MPAIMAEKKSTQIKWTGKDAKQAREVYESDREKWTGIRLTFSRNKAVLNTTDRKTLNLFLLLMD